MSQTYTTCQISENNGKNGKPVWIIIKNTVYDVTKLLKEHPGGDEIILEYAGRDATRAFNDAGHSVDAIQDMKLYKLGTLDNQCSQKSETSAISTPPDQKISCKSEPNEQYCRKEKKRFKLFFCF